MSIVTSSGATRASRFAADAGVLAPRLEFGWRRLVVTIRLPLSGAVKARDRGSSGDSCRLNCRVDRPAFRGSPELRATAFSHEQAVATQARRRPLADLSASS
jgi:hypothetical protein